MVFKELRKEFFLFVFLFLVVVFCFIATEFASGQSQSNFMTEELVPLFKHTPDMHVYPFSMKFSSDGKHCAYVVNYKKTNKMSACLDDKCSKEWDKITEDSPIINDDGSRMAYIGYDGKEVQLVLDGKSGQKFTTINDVRFSKDGKHLLYWAEKYGKVFVVLDNSKSIEVDEIFGLIFSPDSNKIAFAARIADKWHAFLNGKKGPAYDKVLDVKFSPDSKHFSYLAYQEPIWYAIVDGKKQKYWGARMGNFVFAPDSLRTAYGYYRLKDLKKNDKEGIWKMVVDQKVGPEFDEKFSLFIFSPDSKHYAYVAGKPGKQYIYMDGEQKSEEYLNIKTMKYSYDSKHFVYTALQDDRKFVVIMDDKKHDAYSITTGPIFNDPNSSFLLYVGIKTRGSHEQTMVVNGKPEKIYEQVGIPFYSEDGKHYAYAGLEKDQWRIIYDGKEQKPYERVGIARFGKGSKHLAYTAFEKGKWFLVVDGHEGSIIFDSRNFPNASLYSNAPGHFSFLIGNRKGEDIEFSRMEVKINN